MNTTPGASAPLPEQEVDLHVVIAPATLRASGDMEIHVPSGIRTVRLAPCEPLRSLMVEGGPDTEVLDVSALPEDIMLYTSGLPRLRRLLLPRGTGARLHLALGAAPHLAVEGSIA